MMRDRCRRTRFCALAGARALVGAGLLVGASSLFGAALGADGPSTAADARSGQFDCLIEPYRTITVRSPVTGVIDKLYVSRGSRVQEGEPLVRLDSTVESAAADLALFKSQMNGALESSKSRLLHAESKARRKSDLAASDFASEQDREDAEGDLDVARADVLAAREAKELARLEHAYALAQLNLRLIRSPINGVVIDKAMNVGDLAQPEDGSGYILKLAEIDLLRVKVIVPLAYYKRIKPGQRVDVVPEQPMHGHYAAKVRVVDKVIDAASGTFQVQIDLPNPEDALPGGLRCTVRMW